MRLLDANILMYASFDAFPQHVRTKKWLDAHLAAQAVAELSLKNRPISTLDFWKQGTRWRLRCGWDSSRM